MREQLLTLWPSEAEMRACIKQEAEAIDEAVFLAVHQPMQFKRRDIGAKANATSCTESNLLEEFLTPNLPEGRLIMPIVGNSGVGKSHVIRWIEAQLKRRQDIERLHIIRVPKGSSLKGVLRIILGGLEGPVFDRLRSALESARDHLEPERAARELQTALRHRLEKKSQEAKQRISGGFGQAGDQLLRDFGGERMVPALLGEPLLEQIHWLKRADGGPGVIAMIAQQVTQEVQQGADGQIVDERRHEFKAEDFILSHEIDFGALSRQARECYAKINRDDSTRREQAAQVLNMVLDDAKNDLLQLGDNSLVELFNEVRAELHQQKKELIFLVEDFAVLSGLQGALLQVMIAEAIRGGSQKICAMRTALAYTEGYMAGRDTVLTRARSEWLIEDRPGEDDEILLRIERLVGAYLNASRIGQQKLRIAYERRYSAEWVPIVGTEGLEPDTHSLVDAFGLTLDGYPLFPFNKAAVRQLAHGGSVDSNNRLLFNPRFVINNLLNRVLKERNSFAKGKFPPVDLSDELRSVEVIYEVQRRVPRELLPRYLKVLRLWGDQPESMEEAIKVPSAVFTAFGLEPLDFGLPPKPPKEPTRQGIRRDQIVPLAPQPKPLGEHLAESRWRKLLEDWGSGTVLIQNDARALRGWITEAIFAYLPADALLFKPRTTSRSLINSVYLPRSRGQANVTFEDAFVVVAREEDLADPRTRADVIRMLIAFARRYEIHKNWDYDGAEVDAGLVRDFLERRAPASFEYLHARHFQVQADALSALVGGLLVGARALGVPGVHDRATRQGILAALFADPPEPITGASGQWVELQNILRETRSKWRDMLLEMVGARQGGANAVHAVDATTLIPLVQAVKSDWRLPPVPVSSNNDSDYLSFVRSIRDIHILMEKATREEIKALVEWLPKVLAWFGDELDVVVVQTTLRSLVTEVKKIGLIPNAEFDLLRKELSKLPLVPLISAKEAAEHLAENPSRGKKLSILSKLPGSAIAPSNQFMMIMDVFLKAVADAISGRENATGQDLVQALTQEVEGELSKLQTILGHCEEAR